MMIPLTKKQFKIFLLIFELILLLIIIVGLVLFTNWWSNHKVTPEIVKKNNEAMRLAEYTRHSIKDETLWKQASQEAALIAKTAEDGGDISIFANYRSDDADAEEAYGLVLAGKFDKKNSIQRETLYYDLTRNLAISTPAAYLRQKGKVRLVSVELTYQTQKGGEYRLIDTDIDGVWDNKPSE